MPTLAARIDRFVRWFFTVSPLASSIEPEPPRRAAASMRRQARPASPGNRRDARALRRAKGWHPNDTGVA